MKSREKGDSAEIQNQKPGSDFLTKILLVIDGSESSQNAAIFAVRLAQSTGAKIVAVYIIDTATMDYLLQMRIFITEEREELEATLEQKGKRYLSLVKEKAEQRGVEISTCIAKGRQSKAILHMARSSNVSAIVLGGWNNELQQKDVSSIERQLILDAAECPVLVIK